MIANDDVEWTKRIIFVLANLKPAIGAPFFFSNHFEDISSTFALHPLVGGSRADSRDSSASFFGDALNRIEPCERCLDATGTSRSKLRLRHLSKKEFGYTHDLLLSLSEVSVLCELLEYKQQ